MYLAHRSATVKELAKVMNCIQYILLTHFVSQGDKAAVHVGDGDAWKHQARGGQVLATPPWSLQPDGHGDQLRRRREDAVVAVRGDLLPCAQPISNLATTGFG